MSLGGAAVHLTTEAQLDRENPWPGLASYDESSFEYFSGRLSETHELLRRILDEPITILFGKSGLGKTSLLKAGVFPFLRARGFFPVLVRLQIRAGAEPLTEQVRSILAMELRAQGIEHTPPDESETLWEFLHRAGQEFWTPQNRLVRPVLVFDQFEELFTLGKSAPADVARFREDLADLAENRIPAALAGRLDNTAATDLGLDVQAMPYKLVVTLREDFLADLEGWRAVMPSLRRNRMRLLPMGQSQALQAVWNDRTSHLVDESLARKVVAFLASGPGKGELDESLEGAGPTVEPALLSLFCRGVNEHRKKENKRAFDLELLEGGKETIVADFYRTSLADQPARVRRFIEDELITEHGYRNSYSVDDAIARRAVTAKELETLINRHLLRHEHHLGTERVELTHDLLTKAVADERDNRRQRERTSRERRERLRLTVIAGVAILIAVVFLGLAIRASRAERLANIERDRSRSRELGALAETRINADPELAIALALEGLARADTAEARSALLEAARYSWPSAILGSEQLHGKPDAIAISNDGRMLAVVTDGKSISAWDVTTRKPAPLWKEPLTLPETSAVVFSPDGRLVAVARRTSIELVDTASGRVVRALGGQPDMSDRRIVFSPDGQWIATNDADGFLRVIDHANDPDNPRRVEAPNVVGFVLVSGDRIIGVRDPLAAIAINRQPDGTWTSQEYSLGSCMRPNSVSPGIEFFSATWRAHACTFNAADGNESSGGTADRATEDIVWSAAGRASVELLVAQNGASDLLVGRHLSGRDGSPIKGAHLSRSDSERSRLISVSEAGTRLALIDDDAEHKLVRVYSLAGYKPFLSRVDEDRFAISRDAAWAAIATPDMDDKTLEILSIGLEPFDDGGLLPVRARIPVATAPAGLAATRDSIVAILRTDPTTTAAFDAATGAPRFKPLVGAAVPIGATGELLLMPPETNRPWQLFRTRDGAAVPMPARFAGQDPVFVMVSPQRQALAAVRIQPSKEKADGVVYSVSGETIALSGYARDLPLEDISSMILADDGRSIDDGHGVRQWMVTRTAEEPVPAMQKRPEGSSPSGKYLIQPDSSRVVRAADGGVVKHFPIPIDTHKFSSDDRWLAVADDDHLQVFDLGRNQLAFTLRLARARDFEFVAENRILQVRQGGDVMFLPLDLDLLRRFARWVAARDLTAEERSLIGLEPTGAKDH